ncbi:MAG TPA: proline racemase family protein [Bryobacteraceae bacterium]|nr:proline racemase family protein [Bryobacteraceae bacterium]
MLSETIERVSIIDSHTAGEPTRTVIGGGPHLGAGTMADRLRWFREKFDTFRSAVVNEPRGSDVIVGALLQTPVDPGSACGVIFFNNTGFLGMCGHGTIGIVATLAHLGRIREGMHRIETPVGPVHATWHSGGRVSVENVPAYCHAQDVFVNVPGIGRLSGDVAWGGNWFFLVENHSLPLEFLRVEELVAATTAIRRTLGANGITGAGGEEIEHIELCGPPGIEGADSKNFVLCPGGAYDRSPCGTGTSARLACLAEKGMLKPGQLWRQESIIGSTFEASYRIEQDKIIPTITGSAFITAEATLIMDPDDPFRTGIR